MNSIKLKKFDLSQIKNDSTVLVVGRRRSGKSWVIRDLMYTKKDIPSGVVFSGTADVNPFFNTFIPETFIYDSLEIPALEKIINRQETKVKQDNLKNAHKHVNNKERPFNKFIILDDVLHDTKWVSDSTIKKILFNGRHYNIFFVLAIQYINSIPQKLMTNFDYVFLFNETSTKNRKKLYESFCGVIENYNTFHEIFTKCTKEYGCLVIDTHGSDIDDSIYYYKSHHREPFKVGNKAFWKYSTRNIKDEMIIKIN